MKKLRWASGLLVLVALGAGAFVWSGAYNIAADEPHWDVTRLAMEQVRKRSVVARASGIEVPDLENAALVRTGAGNYDAMCADCHLKPGVEKSELSRGLYPAPPDLSRHRIADPAAAFWVIKHGIKMSGMPAWGKSMEDEYVWGMVAFLRKLPDLSQAQYAEVVEASGGHQHGGADAAAHESHADGEVPEAVDVGIEDHAKAPPHKH